MFFQFYPVTADAEAWQLLLRLALNILLPIGVMMTVVFLLIYLFFREILARSHSPRNAHRFANSGTLTVLFTINALCIGLSWMMMWTHATPLFRLLPGIALVTLAALIWSSFSKTREHWVFSQSSIH